MPPDPSPGTVKEPYTLGPVTNSEADHARIHGVLFHARIRGATHIRRKRMIYAPAQAHSQGNPATRPKLRRKSTNRSDYR